MKPFNKFAACVGSLALLALGSTSASALSTWNFRGDGIPILDSYSVEFTSNDFRVLTARGFTQGGTVDPLNVSVPIPIHQNGNGIGVGFGELTGQLDAFPNSHVGATSGLCLPFIGCITPPTPAFEIENAFVDVIRLELGGEGWFPKDITIEEFGVGEFAQVFGGDDSGGNDAVLVNTLEGIAGDPDLFLLDDSQAFNFIFIAALAVVEDCPQGTGLCGSGSRLRIASFSGSEVPEPGALALLGVGLVGLAMTRRRRKVAA